MQNSLVSDTPEQETAPEIDSKGRKLPRPLSMTPNAVKLRKLRKAGVIFPSDKKQRALRQTLKRRKGGKLPCPYCRDHFQLLTGLAVHVKAFHPQKWKGTLKESLPPGFKLPKVESPLAHAQIKRNLEKARKARWARPPRGVGLLQTPKAIRKRAWYHRHRTAKPKRKLSKNPLAVYARKRYWRDKEARLAEANGALPPAATKAPAPAAPAAPAGRVVNYCPQCGWDLRGTLKAQQFIDSAKL